MKVYFYRFELNNKTAYKFGHTKYYNTNKRFLHEQYKVFDSVEEIDSIYLSHADPVVARTYAKIVEEILKTLYPKNFWLEAYFGTEKGFFNQLSGITEMFVLEDGQSEDQILAQFQQIKAAVEKAVKHEQRAPNNSNNNNDGATNKTSISADKAFDLGYF
jgi:hypothetical protein